MTETLLACPFCGAPAGKVEHMVGPVQWADGRVDERRAVMCSEIFRGCMGQGASGSNEAEAIALWNRRADSSECASLREQVAQLTADRYALIYRLVFSSRSPILGTRWYIAATAAEDNSFDNADEALAAYRASRSSLTGDTTNG